MKLKELLISARPKWLYTIMVGIVILYLTLDPKPLPDNDLNLIPHFDKIAHAIMFGGFAGAVVFDVARRAGKNYYTSAKRLIAIFILTVAFGGLIEIAQASMGLGRGADWFDFLADAIGAAVAVFAAPPVARAIVR